MMVKNMEKQEEILTVLKDILKWIRFSGLENARAELRRVLDTEQKRLIYSLSNGEKTSREISEKCGVSDFTVRKYWSDWYKRGIVEPLGVRGGTRYMKSFNLEALGLMVPDVNSGVEGG